MLGGCWVVFLPPRPLELEDDGVQIYLIRKMIRGRGEGTVCKRYLCVMARYGSWIVMEIIGLMRLPTLGGGGCGLTSLMLVVIFLGSVGVGTPVVKDLHRFFVAGHPGLAPDPLVWSAGGLPKRRRIVRAVRDAALLPGPAPIWGMWVGGSSSHFYHC